MYEYLYLFRLQRHRIDRIVNADPLDQRVQRAGGQGIEKAFECAAAVLHPSLHDGRDRGMAACVSIELVTEQ
jgi:hypothetical protein